MNIVGSEHTRPKWNYTPALQFYHRMLVVAMLDACEGRHDGTPADEALIARDWIATSKTASTRAGRSEFVSFPQCCRALCLDPDIERVGMLALIDDKQDFDTDEAWERLEALRRKPLVSDEGERLALLPSWCRAVPVLDQLSLPGL